MYACVTLRNTNVNDIIHDCVTLHNTNVNDIIHDCVALHNAHTCKHIHWASCALSQVGCCVFIFSHALWLKFESFMSSPWPSMCVRSLHLDPPFLLLALPSAPFPLPQLHEVYGKPAQLLQWGWWTPLTTSSSTGYEPKAHDFYETTVEPHVQFLDSPPLFSNKVSSADPDYNDATLEDMLHQVHRAQVYHSLREDLSVSLSSSSMSDRTGQLVGDRSEQAGEHRSSEAQIRTLLDDQKEQILAECQARISQHEFQAARAEEEQRPFQGQLLQQKLEFREAHQRSLTEMEELRKFQSSAFDTMARRKFIEDQNTILELSGRVQELENKINCMSDSKEFQDAESIRSGISHVTSRPVSFPPHPIPEGMLRHSFVTPSRREGPPSIWDTHGISGNVFCRSRCVIISTLSSRIESMEFIDRRAAPFIHSGEKWKVRTRSRSEMPVWTVSQRFSHLQWRRLFKELWGRPTTTTADFGSSLRQIPYTKSPVQLRWGPWQPGRERASHRFWAQGVPHHGGLCRLHPGIHRCSSGPSMTSTTMTSPPARRSLTRAEDEPITLKKNACRPVCRRPSVMMERWDPL